ncbi:hypothetical protein KSD_07640 [Ktedonobacter sp. SOSP1-85]|nr:hypothetical protein KSD_07640 [Ktedonobacter sp. SOSP1-85]
MAWSSYSPDNHKCRVILKTGIDEFLQRRLDEDNEPKRRDMESGKVYNRVSQKEVHARMLEANNALVEASLCENEAMREVHRAMLNDLNNLPLTLFQGLADKHYNEAWSVASHLPYEDESDRRKLQLELQEVRDMPKPFYHPSGQQARVYSSGGLANIKKEVRRAFFLKEEGHVELDIACCNLSIVARLWNIESIQEIQQQRGSVWSELLDYMETSDELRAITKPILKQGVCSSIYGMKASNVEGQVTLEFGGKTLKGKGENRYAKPVKGRPVLLKEKRFTDNPLIADLLQAINLAKQEIRDDGGYNGAYGFIEYDGVEDIDSYLCRVIGSYELAIVASCFELARERGDFQVVLYQYDGVTIKVAKNDRPDRVASVLTAIQHRASQVAQSFGIYTTLEPC